MREFQPLGRGYGVDTVGFMNPSSSRTRLYPRHLRRSRPYRLPREPEEPGSR